MTSSRAGTFGLLLLGATASLRCGGSGSSAPPGPTTGPASSADAATADASGATSTACDAAALEEPRAATTYFVATAQPGADNDRCDGLSPTDAGGGHCPFKDFSAERTKRLLDQTKSVRVSVRAGTYVIAGWEGIRVAGAGTNEGERVILSAYPGEKVVFDVADPEGVSCKGQDPTTAPACVREVVRVSGTYTLVQGITIQNGLAFDLEITGGAHHEARCNTFTHTSGWVSSDSLKLDALATDVRIHHNDFTRWRSQAIDITGVSNVLVEDNEFHDPLDADGGALGVKFGARDITVRRNHVHHLGAATNAHVFALGGTGSPHPDDFSAYGVHVVDNRVHDVRGILAQITTCDGCSVERNDVSDLGAGVLVSRSGTGGSDCSTVATGCNPSRGTKVAGNRMRHLDGGGDAAQANLFVWVEGGESAGLAVAENLYCATSTAEARFGWETKIMDFAAWQQASATDATSKVLALADPACAAW